ncbi:hypothetical protein [Hyphococcus sp.]|uniref:hypothetical protein n=1 Tax=Hyphococcus sp. TaxID=2038636 RepID=UPI003CCBD692
MTVFNGILSALSMMFRVIAIAIGGIVLTGGVAALSGMALQKTGVPLKDAMLATALLSYVLYIPIVMWGFRDRRTLLRPLAVIAMAALTLTVASYFAPGALEA